MRDKGIHGVSHSILARCGGTTYSLGEGEAAPRGAGASGRTCVLQGWMAMHYNENVSSLMASAISFFLALVVVRR